jgi:DNA replication protein DnaC
VGLINELSGAQQRQQLGRALARWSRYDVVAIDEVGYVPTTEEGAKLLYQIISRKSSACRTDSDYESSILGMDDGV